MSEGAARRKARLYEDTARGLVAFDGGGVLADDTKDVFTFDVHAGDRADTSLGLGGGDGGIAHGNQTEVGSSRGHPGAGTGGAGDGDGV